MPREEMKFHNGETVTAMGKSGIGLMKGHLFAAPYKHMTLTVK